MSGGLLAVHAHPDDETISTGALLATWAGAGLPATVLTCTRGEQGEVIGAHLRHLEGAGEAFARHRESELAAALRALGVEDHLFLDEVDVARDRGRRIVDSGMSWVGAGRAGASDDVPEGAFVAVPVDAVVDRLVRVLLDRRPAVVATYEPGGGYGHPDHVRAHEVTVAAVRRAVGEGLAPPVVLWAVHERDAWRAAAHEVRAAGIPDGLVALDPDAGEPTAVVAGPADLRVDTARVRAQVLDALRAHGTQVQAVDGVEGTHAVGRFALSNGVVQPLLRHETYRRADGDVHAVAWPDGCVLRGVTDP